MGMEIIKNGKIQGIKLLVNNGTSTEEVPINDLNNETIKEIASSLDMDELDKVKNEFRMSAVENNESLKALMKENEEMLKEPGCPDDTAECHSAYVPFRITFDLPEGFFLYDDFILSPDSFLKAGIVKDCTFTVAEDACAKASVKSPCSNEKLECKVKLKKVSVVGSVKIQASIKLIGAPTAPNGTHHTGFQTIRMCDSEYVCVDEPIGYECDSCYSHDKLCYRLEIVDTHVEPLSICFLNQVAAVVTGKLKIIPIEMH